MNILDIFDIPALNFWFLVLILIILAIFIKIAGIDAISSGVQSVAFIICTILVMIILIFYLGIKFSRNKC